MAIAQRGKTTNIANADTVTATLTDTPLENSLLVAFAHTNQQMTAPANWSVAGLNMYNIETDTTDYLSCFYKVAGPAESASLTITATGATRTRLHLFEYTGLDPNEATVRLSTGGSYSLGQAVTLDSSNMNVSVDSLILCCIALNNNSGGWNNTWTDGYVQQTALNAGGAYPASTVAHRIVAAPGGSYRTNETWNTARSAVSIHVAFQVEPVGGGEPDDKVKVKTAGAFGAAKPKVKTGGTFAEVAQKVKVGGSWIEL